MGNIWIEGVADSDKISYIACPRCVAEQRRQSFEAEGGLTTEEQIEEAKRSGF
jgi:hypothetical protein